MVAWPSISETILGLTFLPSRSVAHVCRKSRNLIGGSYAAESSGLKERLRRFEGLMMVPVFVAKTRPPG